MYRFRLFITGFKSKTSQKAIKDVTDILDEYFKNIEYAFSVIDIIDDPQCARRKGIFATPVLVKTKPKPESRVTGSFECTEDVLEKLEIYLTNAD